MRDELKQRLREEVRKYLLVSAWLFACCFALLLYRAALTDGRIGHGVVLLAALVKALILAKFVLIGDAAGGGTRLTASALWARVAWRSGALLVVLAALTSVEELVVGFVHGRSVEGTLGEMHARSTPELAAETLLLVLALVPLVAAAEVGWRRGAAGAQGAVIAPDDGRRDETSRR